MLAAVNATATNGTGILCTILLFATIIALIVGLAQFIGIADRVGIAGGRLSGLIAFAVLLVAYILFC